MKKKKKKKKKNPAAKFPTSVEPEMKKQKRRALVKKESKVNSKGEDHEEMITVFSLKLAPGAFEIEASLRFDLLKSAPVCSDSFFIVVFLFRYSFSTIYMSKTKSAFKN